MDKIKTLVTLQHGSHLYGLDHVGSDMDLYTVYDYNYKNHRPNKQIEQLIETETDHLKISLDKFIEHLKNGTPQAVEVLFSHKGKWLDYDPDWEGIAGSLEQLLDTRVVMETYRRTIMHVFEKDDFKKNRHGFRLMLNADELKRTYRFNPTLSAFQIEIITSMAELPWAERLNKYKAMLWDIYG